MTVTLAHLFPHFDTLIQTPADLQRLNETILQLAVQGKLVPQDPSDEPAGVLLERIAAEKAGGSRKENQELQIATDGLPKGWMRVDLGVVIELISGQHIMQADYNSANEGTPYLTGPADFGELYPVITKWTTKPKVIAQAGDILITVKGAGLGKLNIIDLPEVAISRQLMAVRSVRVLNDYIYLFLRSEFRTFQDSGVGIAIPGLSREHINKLPFPLPPLAEQKRIVAKVDELLAQTRALEAKLRRAAEEIVVVNRAVLHRVQTAPDAATFAHAVHTLRTHFAPLTTDPRTLTDLRQTILQLAVQGKLVPQDPRDEPAGVLLERIGQDQRLVDEETLYELPIGWKWVRVGQVCDCIVPNRDKPKTFTGSIPWITLPDFDGSLEISESKSGQGLTEEEIIAYRARLVPAGSVVMSCIGRFGIVGILGQDAVINQQLHAFLPPDFLDNRYLAYALMTQVTYMEALATSTTILYLNKTNCNSIPLALPPLAEQKRIVAKVDELLARCDGLAAKLGAAQVAGGQLTAAVLSGVAG